MTWGNKLTQVAILRLSDDVSVDQDELARIYIKMECTQSEDMVLHVMQELEQRLSHAENLYRLGELRDLESVTRAITSLSKKLGMSTLARISEDVADCCLSDDIAALAATQARLTRLGRGSLREISELKNLSI